MSDVSEVFVAQARIIMATPRRPNVTVGASPSRVPGAVQFGGPRGGSSPSNLRRVGASAASQNAPNLTNRLRVGGAVNVPSGKGGS